MLILFAILWLVSPLVLAVVTAVLYSKNKRMHNFISQLYSSGRITDRERNDLEANQPIYPNMAPPSSALQNNYTAQPAPPVQNSDFTPQMQVNTPPSVPCGNIAPSPCYVPPNVQNIPPFANNTPVPFVPQNISECNSAAQYPQTAPKKSERISSISVILMIGVIFVVLAGIFFAKASWADLPDFARVITLSSFGMIFFGVCAIAERKLELHRTGSAFFALGSMFLPISITASGLLGLFGDYMSFTGEGHLLSYSLGFAVLSIASIIGVRVYKSRPYAVVFLSSLTLFVSTLLISFLNYDAVSFFMAIYALGIVIIANKYSDKLQVFSDVLVPFALISTFVLSMLTLPDSSPLSGFSAFMFAFVFLMPVFGEKLKVFSPVPVTIFLYIGAFRMFDSFAETAIYSFALAAVILILLAVFGEFSDEIKTVYHIIALCSTSLHIIVTFIITCIFSCDNILQPVTTVILLAVVLICAGIKNSRLLYSCLPAQLTLALIQFVSYFTNFSETGVIILLYLLIAQYLLFAFAKRIRTQFSDVFCVLVLPISAFMCMFVDNNGLAAFSAVSAFVIIPLLCMFAIVRPSFNKVSAGICAAFFPILTVLSTLYACALYDFKYAEICCISALVFAFLSIVVFSRKPLEIHNVIACISTSLVAFASTWLMHFDNSAEYIVYFIVAVIFAYLFYVYQKQNSEGFSKLYFYAFGLSLVASISAIIDIHCQKNITEYTFVLTAVLTLAFAAVYTWLSKSKENTAVFSLGFFTLTFVPIFALIYSCAFTTFPTISAWQLAICTLVCIVAIVQSKKYLFAAVGGVSFYVSLDLWLEFLDIENASIYFVIGLVFAAFALLALVLGKYEDMLYVSKIFRAMTFGVPLLIFISNPFYKQGIIDYSQFFFLLFSSPIPLLYCDFSQKSEKRCVLESISTALLTLCIIQQPFFDFAGTFFEGKMYLVPIMLAAFALKYIWPQESAIHKNALFAGSIWSIISLSMSAISSNSLADAFLILSIALIMLIASFVFKRKKWFVLSAVTLVTLSIYLSDKFGLRLGWSAYLLIAGVILISIAASNEYCKTKGESLKDKAGRFWQEWTW